MIQVFLFFQVNVYGFFSSTLLLYFLHDNLTILWIGCASMGFFAGPIIPSCFAWANRYIEVTSAAQIAPEIGAAIGDVVFLVVVGYSYQNFGPYIIWAFQIILGICLCLIACIMQILGSTHGDRYNSVDGES